MEKTVANPLFSYFRQPAIYLELPSKGSWWPKDSLNLPENNQIPIYPMSTKDEILLRTPDALLNGQGVVDVIQSCCPAIINAWNTPIVDLDPLLIGIRIASYGNNMDFDSSCPHCKHENKHGVDLGKILGQYRCPDYNNLVKYKDLKIKLKPQNYYFANKNNMNDFSEQKLLNILGDESIPEETRKAEISKIVQRIYNLGIDNCVNSTNHIEMPDGEKINSPDHITEFYHKAASSLVKSIQEKMQEISKNATSPELDLQCENCSEKYKVNITFDYSSFFGKSS